MQEFKSLCVDENDVPFEYDGSNISMYMYFFKEKPNLYFGFRQLWGVVSAKVLDGTEVLKAIESVKRVRRSWNWISSFEGEIKVNCGKLNDRCIKSHNLKNYTPKYHNIIKGSKIPHQYVYRSGQGRDDACQYSFRLSSFHGSAASSLLNEMPYSLMAYLLK
ncbi:hypothetical protein POM88_047261 [Heracleum sosnowskyi]|uniref:Uncharacterized protein n=1 Tax=Heracleum sosnowskyi TaxID=360622 RepID=A0AAD8GRT9_9APIA|nr:hypothetical protein POM88_047261 [Heracleum sosnowskyi]